MESILTSIKKLLGITEDCEDFDQDIIVAINTTFMSLHQLGVGPSTPFFITGNTETWDDVLQGRLDLNAVKTYVHLKTKLIFDPPLSTPVTESINRMIGECEWRLFMTAEHD